MKKIFLRILCVVLSVLLGFSVSFKLSFYETQESDFLIKTTDIGEKEFCFNGEACCMKIEGNYEFLDKKYVVSDSIRFTVDESCDWFNYFGVKYISDAYLKGTIVYRDCRGINITEDFFLEASETENEFFSFIDTYLEKNKASKIISVEFKPLDKETANFRILGLSTFNREIFDREVYLSTSEYKIGVDLLWGGALSYMEDLNSDVEAIKKDGRIFVDSKASERYNEKVVNSNVNLINRHDPGRLVQQSYYGTFGEGDNYECGNYMGNKWSYNPVQGGNQFNEHSKIVDIRLTDDSIYIKCRPLDWAKSKEHITPSYMEATYTIVNSALHVECRYVDFSGYNSRYSTQELPAFYCIEPFNRFVYYGGNEPWTDDDNIKSEPKLIFWPDAGYPSFNSAENWSAFTGEFEDSFGIGLYVPGRTNFLAGVASREQTTNIDPSVDGPTSYIALVEVHLFESFKPSAYDYYIATGDTDEIRNTFKNIALG